MMGYILPALFLSGIERAWTILSVVALGIVAAIFFVILFGEDY